MCRQKMKKEKNGTNFENGNFCTCKPETQTKSSQIRRWYGRLDVLEAHVNPPIKITSKRSRKLTARSLSVFSRLCDGFLCSCSH